MFKVTWRLTAESRLPQPSGLPESLPLAWKLNRRKFPVTSDRLKRVLKGHQQCTKMVQRRRPKQGDQPGSSAVKKGEVR